MKINHKKKNVHIITGHKILREQLLKKQPNNIKSKIKNKKTLETDIGFLMKRMNKTKKVKYKTENKKEIFRTNNGLSDRSNKNNLLLQDNIKLETDIGIKETLNVDKNSNIDNNSQDKFQLNLVNINVNQLKKKTYIPKESEHILNIYEFEESLKYDKRGLCTIYYIFLISKQVIMHTFFYKSPIEPFPLRLSILKFILGCDLALNAFFYTDDKISERHRSNKNIFAFALTNNFIVIFLSSLIGYAFMIFFSNLNNITNELRKIFREEENKIKKDKNYVVSLQRKKEVILEVKRINKKFKIKVTIFYIIEFILMIFFWYYVTVFCYVYNKTQLSWLIDSFITIVFKIIIDLLFNLLFALMYKASIKFSSNCLYRIIVFFYCFA